MCAARVPQRLLYKSALVPLARTRVPSEGDANVAQFVQLLTVKWRL